MTAPLHAHLTKASRGRQLIFFGGGGGPLSVIHVDSTGKMDGFLHFFQRSFQADLGPEIQCTFDFDSGFHWWTVSNFTGLHSALCAGLCVKSYQRGLQ